jgi:glycosyltransferase involved in cell wall biosynthesis
MIKNQTVSVIVPTLATTERAKCLSAAIDSILSQQEVKAVPIVVANGSLYNPDVLRWLKRRNDIRYVFQESASMPLAIMTGRNMVDTPFFSELDDDDLLLPQALSIRMKGMHLDPLTDAVVTNGILSNQGQEEIHIDDIEGHQRDPLRKLLFKTWLLPGAALFRTETINQEILKGMPEYLEWTYLAIRLSLEKKILFLNDSTVIHYLDHDFSIDKSNEAVLGRPEALRRILTLNLPDYFRKAFKEKLAYADHHASKLYLKNRQYALAWSCHVKVIKNMPWKQSFGIYIRVLQGLLASNYQRLFRPRYPSA